MIISFKTFFFFFFFLSKRKTNKNIFNIFYLNFKVYITLIVFQLLQYHILYKSIKYYIKIKKK